MEALIIILIASAAVFGVAGAIIGSKKNAGPEGFATGTLLGPIGVIVSFIWDNREKCAYCHGRLDGRPKLCPHCRSALDWVKVIEMEMERQSYYGCVGENRHTVASMQTSSDPLVLKLKQETERAKRRAQMEELQRKLRARREAQWRIMNAPFRWLAGDDEFLFYLYRIVFVIGLVFVGIILISL